MKLDDTPNQTMVLRICRAFIHVHIIAVSLPQHPSLGSTFARKAVSAVAAASAAGRARLQLQPPPTSLCNNCTTSSSSVPLLASRYDWGVARRSTTSRQPQSAAKRCKAPHRSARTPAPPLHLSGSFNRETLQLATWQCWHRLQLFWVNATTEKELQHIQAAA